MTNQAKLGRNSPCHCGSGKKFKACCIGKSLPENAKAPIGASIGILIAGLAGAALLLMYKGMGSALAAIGASVIAAMAIYVFRDPNPPRGGSGGDSSAINFGR
jgi:CBS-domain-containing membrane protein